jgi:hypothetical protein
VNIVMPTDMIGREGTPIPTAQHAVEVARTRREDLEYLSGARDNTQWHPGVLEAAPNKMVRRGGGTSSATECS